MDNKYLNSMAYDMYLVMLNYGMDLEKAKYIKSKFDEFYNKIEQKDFIVCEDILQEIVSIIGNNSSQYMRARSVLDFEKEE